MASGKWQVCLLACAHTCSPVPAWDGYLPRPGTQMTHMNMTFLCSALHLQAAISCRHPVHKLHPFTEKVIRVEVVSHTCSCSFVPCNDEQHGDGDGYSGKVQVNLSTFTLRLAQDCETGPLTPVTPAQTLGVSHLPELSVAYRTLSETWSCPMSEYEEDKLKELRNFNSLDIPSLENRICRHYPL